MAECPFCFISGIAHGQQHHSCCSCLGSPLCHPHTCHHCGVQVDGTAMHGLSCKWSEGHQHHAAVNDIVHHTMSTAHLPSRLEPTGLSHSNGKRPDRVTLVPWRSGRLLVWDATCPDTFPPTYQVPPERQVQWQPWLSGASRRSTQPSTNATTSHRRPLRQQALWARDFCALERTGLPSQTGHRGSQVILLPVATPAHRSVMGKFRCSDGNNGGHHLPF